MTPLHFSSSPGVRPSPWRTATLLFAVCTLHTVGAYTQQPDQVPTQQTAPLPPADPAFHTSAPAASEQILHLSVGHLLFLNAKARIRRVFIANPTVLDSYNASPHQIVLTARNPGLSAVVLWDEFDKPQAYTVSADLDIADLRGSIARALPSATIRVEASGGKVILDGTVATLADSDTAGKLAAIYSKDILNSLVVNSARIRQVQLKVRIVEIDRSRLNQFGINLFNPGGGSTLGGATTAQFPTTATLAPGAANSSASSLTISDPLNFLFYSAKANFGATIRDLENKQLLQILAEPTITAISGQKASFISGGEFPFPVVQGGAGGLTSITIQFRPYGVKLDFTPEVNADGSIALKVSPEVSALDYTNSVTISGYTIPALSTRRADTQVVLRSGQSFAISGLLDKRTTDSLGRTPGISSIPVLGALFKSKGINLSTTELIVIVTPTIVDPLTDLSTPAEPATVRPFLNPGVFTPDLPKPAEKP